MRQSFVNLSKYCIIFSALIYSIVLTAESNLVSDKVILVTDNLPPYSYKNKEGTFVGPTIDKIKVLFEAASLDYEIKQYSWKRAMFEQTKANRLIYPLSRTPERESKFEWVTVLQTLSFKLYSLKSKTQLNNVDIT